MTAEPTRAIVGQRYRCPLQFPLVASVAAGWARRRRWAADCRSAKLVSPRGDAGNWPVLVAACAPVSRSWLEGT